MESNLLNKELDMESSSDRPTMIQQQMIKACDQFQTSRMEFMQTVSDFSNNLQNMNNKSLQKEKIISQLRLLTLDEDPSIHHNAVLALGRLVEHSEELATIVVKKDILRHLIQSIPSQDQHYKKAAVFVLRAVAKHSPELSQAVVVCGGLDTLVLCLGAVDPEVKEAAAWALGHIAKQNAMLSQTVVSCGGLDALALCSKDFGPEVKEAAAWALGNIAQQKAIPPQAVITLMWEVVKHSAKLSQVIVNYGGLAEVVDYLDKSRGNMRLPGIMMLGYVASHSEDLAMAVILSKGVHQLAVCLSEEDEDHIKAATVRSIGQIGHHTPEHAKAVATAGLLPKVLQLYTEASSSEDLRLKSKKALKNILLKSTHLPSLEPLFDTAPRNILNHVLGQFSKVLPHDCEARQEFVMSGGLSKVKEMDAEPGSALWKQINAIKSCFQEEEAKKQCSPSSHTQPSKLQEPGTQCTPPPPRKPASRPTAGIHPPLPTHAPTPNPRGKPREPPIRDPSRRAKSQHTSLPPQTPATRTPACTQPPKSIHAPTPNYRGRPREPPIQDPSRKAKTLAQGKTSGHPTMAGSRASRGKTPGTGES